ncbi:hypothetical protein [Nocardia transvalensis]|uniref:hypothetical protein n=1 Tax=Nocardia transvalensis TaxID=37333 RepID=UPI001893C7C7|nr:hypothetical protein [Nocardia transvalensis]MBF6333559.1 hypothetical protein [Nocardia transvalensis]
MPSASAHIGWVPKAGRDPGENDDRAAAGVRRFAVADGAATSARAEVWADILVRAFVEDHLDPFDPTVLPRLRTQWQTEVDLPDLPWHAVAKLQLGGAATFVGLELDEDQRRYRCCAIGDACLLHLRAGRLLTAGPLQRPDQFGRDPALITTRAGDESHHAAVWRTDGAYHTDDRFVLATDALAKYLLRHHHNDTAVDLSAALTDGFSDWVAAARAGDGLDNDDTTLLLVHV